MLRETTREPVAVLPNFSGRFQFRRKLGQGGIGDVYEVFDSERRAVVALKVLRALSGAGVYRFKGEFRSLAGVTHRNLVRLYELSLQDDAWFLTMELVPGQHFIDFVRPRRRPEVPPPRTVEAGMDTASPCADAALITEADLTTAATLDGGQGPTLPDALSRMRESARRVGDELDSGRLRSALLQLVEGLQALHDAGKLHLDVKPSNVLVAPDGRVVVVDFGLVTDAPASTSREAPAPKRFVGTPAYMSPEQAALRPVSAASDWYSVGVVLFEALTGRRPFIGTPGQVVRQKQAMVAPRAHTLAPFVPRDLDELCEQLLRRNPEERPSGTELLQRLGAGHAGSSRTPWQLRALPTLVGRKRELQQLDDAYQVARRGQTAIACVRGRSGIGKSALLRGFVDEVIRNHRASVFEGRCYEQESVPYKALDAVVDSLTTYLLELGEGGVDVLPTQIGALARLFPVLRRLGPSVGAAATAESPPDPQESRRRAFAALRELLARVSIVAGPVVLAIDDVQWGDLDSARLLAEVLRPPDAPSLLLVAAYRSEDVDTSPFLRAFLTAHPTARMIPVEPLSLEESCELVHEFSQGDERVSPAVAERIAGEAAGSPLFLTQLVHEALDESTLPRATTLEALIARRIATGRDTHRRLLEAVAVAARPIPQGLAALAASAGSEAPDVIDELKAKHFVRTRGIRGSDLIEIYHDRIREAVVKSLSAEQLRAWHAALAGALEGAAEPDVEALALHHQGAGDTDKAATYAALAGRESVDAMAFERAARMFRMALELSPDGESAQLDLKSELAVALANSGRTREAAAAFMGAAEAAPLPEGLDLRRRAAEQLLIGGHVEEGMKVLREVLAALGLEFPRTPTRAMLRIAAYRAVVAMRGLKFKERDASELPARELERIDACWSSTIGLSMVDTFYGTSFQTRHLLMALRAGERLRVARALCLEGVTLTWYGTKTLPRVEALFARADAIARQLGSEELDGIILTTKGAARLLLGEFTASGEWCDRAEAWLRERCAGVLWWLDNAQIFGLWAHVYRGDMAGVVRRVPHMIQLAEERGDLFAMTGFRTGPPNLAWLAADDVDGASTINEAAIARWPERGFLLQH